MKRQNRRPSPQVGLRVRAQGSPSLAAVVLVVVVVGVVKVVEEAGVAGVGVEVQTK